MSHGQLRACGSSLFLKARFGVGYTLVLSKKEDGCNEANVMQLVQSHSPKAEVLSAVGTEISFRLPFEDSKHFSQLFAELDAGNASNKFGIETYGISVTTLEEVCAVLLCVL